MKRSTKLSQEFKEKLQSMTSKDIATFLSKNLVIAYRNQMEETPMNHNKGIKCEYKHLFKELKFKGEKLSDFKKLLVSKIELDLKANTKVLFRGSEIWILYKDFAIEKRDQQIQKDINDRKELKRLERLKKNTSRESKIMRIPRTKSKKRPK